MYGHFQIGENQPLNIDASSLDFSGMSQKQLGLTNLPVGYSLSINLFRSGINSVSLAFGKVFITNRGNNQFQINQDVFDFNIEWQNGFSARNAGTLLGAFINYNLFANSGVRRPRFRRKVGQSFVEKVKYIFYLFKFRFQFHIYLPITK